MIPDNWKPSTDKFKDITNDLPTIPNINPNITYNMSYPDMSNILPASPTNIYLEQPQTPQLQTSPLFSPSISLGGMGGGLSENLPLLLLLGAGVGGFALGRKKRKKKKYKKKRKHK